MTSIFVKTNVAQLTDVVIDDLGVLVLAAGGTPLEFDTVGEFNRLQSSDDLLALLTDDIHGVGSSTLVLNDGISDVPQGAVETYLTSLTNSQRLSGPVDLVYVSGKLDRLDYDSGDSVQLTYNGTSGALEQTIGGGETTNLTYTGGVLTRVS